MPKELVTTRGEIAWSAAHSAYGKVLKTHEDGSGASSPFRLLGQVADDDAELTWTRFRCFDPEIGAWISTDPLEIAGGLNLYGFDGAPTRFIDELGLAGTSGGSGHPIWTPANGKTPAENAYGHWNKHGQEFPEYQNSLQYVEGAHSFVSAPPASAVTKVRPNGDTVIYDPVSDKFAVQAANGAPRTMFRPDPAKHGYASNLDYFDAQ